MDKDKVIDYVMNTPHNTNRQVLEGMLDGADSGAGLPAVSEEDEGKVLTVVNGEWDKAESSSNDNIFQVNFRLIGMDYTADKTFAEVYEAISNGKNVFVYYNRKQYFIDSVAFNKILFISISCDVSDSGNIQPVAIDALWYTNNNEIDTASRIII